jgi:hypothetical protein
LVHLWIPVLGVLQTIEYGTQSFISGDFVLLQASGFAGKPGHPAGETSAFLDGQYAPGEDAVCPF